MRLAGAGAVVRQRGAYPSPAVLHHEAGARVPASIVVRMKSASKRMAK